MTAAEAFADPFEPLCPRNGAGHCPHWYDDSEVCHYCGDAPEVEVIARALAAWSSPQYEWEQRHPNNRDHWLRLARKGYEAILAEHATIVAEKKEAKRVA